MAFQVKLVLRLDESSGDLVTLNLDGYTAGNGFDVMEQGWTPSVGSMEESTVPEVIRVRVKGATQDALAAQIQALEDMARWCRNYRNNEVDRSGVWLRAQLDTETGARQALVVSMRHRPISSITSSTVRGSVFIQEYAIELERAPWWEQVTTYKTYDMDNIDCLGGTYTWSGLAAGAMTGDMAARIGYANFLCRAGGPIARVWAGFRSTRYGTIANFQPYWDCAGKTFGADTADQADVTARNATNCARCTFVTVTTMARRVTIKISDVTANVSDQRGSFTVLLRAKVSAAGAVRVRLGDGYYMTASPSSSQYRVQSRVTISNTSWDLYDLGQVNIPRPGHGYLGSANMQNFSLGIDAELVSGGVSLDMDTLILIPSNEGMIYFDGADIDTAGGVNSFVAIETQPDGRVVALDYDSGYAQLNLNARINGGVPIGTGIIVLAAARSASSVLADAMDITLVQTHPRWAVLRGAE